MRDLMNLVFWEIVILIAVLGYFLLSFLFGTIGNIAMKLFKIFKNNIRDEKEKVENE